MSYCISLMKNGSRIYISRQLLHGPQSQEITLSQNQAMLFQRENEARKFLHENCLNELGFFVWFCAAKVAEIKREPKKEKPAIQKVWQEFTPKFLTA